MKSPKEEKNILFLFHLPPPVHGSSIVGSNIMNSIRINSSFDCSYINLLASKDVADSGKVGIKKIFNFIGTYFQVLKSLLRNSPDLCYLALSTTGTAFYKDFFLVAMMNFFNKKLVYHLHNKGVSRYNKSKLANFCYKYVFQNVDVILLSKFLYPDIMQYVPESRVHICPNGISDENKVEGQIPVEKIQRKEEVVKILFLSNLIQTKGIFVLLDALVHLKEKGLPFKCDIVGSESDVTSKVLFEKIVALGLEDEVCYLGEKYGVEKKQIFLDADIFTFPTYYQNETFGLVLIEAMSFSLPVISTFEGGIPDIVEDGVSGFLIAQKNVEMLAEKLGTLINDPDLRQKMGMAGRIKYEQEFTLQKFENKLTEILNQIA